MKNGFWAYSILLFSTFGFMQPTESLSAEEKIKHCVIEYGNYSDENLVAVTDSQYFQLALAINQPPGPFLYVMSRKPPFHGKAFFVEVMNVACETVSFYLHADDGSRAFLTIFPNYENAICEPCTYYSSYQKAVLHLYGLYGKKDTILESLLFGLSSQVRLWGFPTNQSKSPNTDSNTSYLEREVLSASRSICRIEHDINKGKKIDDCVARKSGESSVELERKLNKDQVP